MQVSAVISFLAAAVMTVRADSFSAEDQAIWIDRHNYFRTTGLPWSAGDMRRIGWSSDLATSAASTASKCSATSAAGVNAYESSSANSSSIIDEAIQQWVVETSVTTLKTLPQPGASGIDVGTGTYNSYSQVLWASTTSVGCATASCPSGEIVVCEYSPAGNDGSSPWYVHADTASDCPSGTTASQGLCIVEGDAANNQIAAIPAGKLTSSKEDSSAATKTGLSKKTTPSSSSSDTSSESSSTATKTGKTTSDTSKQTATSSSSSSSSESSSTTTKTGKTTQSTDSTEDSSTKQTAASNSDESAPGTVKASSDTGSTFTNQDTSKTTESSTEQTSSNAPRTANTESTTGSGGASSINNKSSTAASGGISAAGMAGMIVLAIVAMAAFGVVMSYKRNQKRQREIMRDGGIRII
ncbi:hypothetical protein JG687_00001701 [Phytophthora cactorum]|uniref:SCP domain-containing protein n=1 Tax=Phytophthora cactorum TaxID=29920 RepID=A0A8T1UXD9_9STRA|nr:hypothetical protein JG687_00001701 [Phytophthora cactorum]